MPVCAAHAAESVGTATLTEIRVPRHAIQGAAAVDLAAAGYTETEYYASGTANRYNGTSAVDADSDGAGQRASLHDSCRGEDALS